jgi:large conductance mechanosensitive channel
MEGFRNFLFRGNVVDLAVAVVIGAAFNQVIEGFVTAFVNPLIGLILGGQVDAEGNITALTSMGIGGFPIGVFLSALILFILKAAIVYFFIVRPFSGIAAKMAANNPPPADITLLGEIRDLLKQGRA